MTAERACIKGVVKSAFTWALVLESSIWTTSGLVLLIPQNGTLPNLDLVLTLFEADLIALLELVLMKVYERS